MLVHSISVDAMLLDRTFFENSLCHKIDKKPSQTRFKVSLLICFGDQLKRKKTANLLEETIPAFLNGIFYSRGVLLTEVILV